MEYTRTITGGHMIQAIRTHDGPKHPFIPLFLHTKLGLDYQIGSRLLSTTVNNAVYTSLPKIQRQFERRYLIQNSLFRDSSIIQNSLSISRQYNPKQYFYFETVYICYSAVCCPVLLLLLMLLCLACNSSNKLRLFLCGGCHLLSV